MIMNKLNIIDRNLDTKSHMLRSKGMIPGVMYGPNISNKPIKTSLNEIKRATQNSGEIYKVSSRSGDILVKFGEIQKDPVSKEVLHFSLVEMPKGIKNELDLPVEFQGTPTGVKKGGVFIVLKDEITVNGKPKMMPESLEANVSKMEIGDKLLVKDINIPNKIESMEDDSLVVAICKPPVKEVATADLEVHEPELIGEESAAS